MAYTVARAKDVLTALERPYPGHCGKVTNLAAF